MDYDLIVIGAGYGGFDAAKHAAEKGLKTAIIESREMGGTCVNRGCVPSKALLAASGRVRELSDGEHRSSFGITPGTVQFDRQAIANHSTQLVKMCTCSNVLELKDWEEGALPYLSSSMHRFHYYYSLVRLNWNVIYAVMVSINSV